MTYKPKLIEKIATKEDHNGYSRNIVKYENKCLRCDKIFTAHCSGLDRYEFKRICTPCKYRMSLNTNAEELF